MNNAVQPTLFDAWETSTGALELFPAVWNAAQNLAHPEAKVRKIALENLVEMGAPRLSPLVAYLIATRLQDPDMDIRLQVVKILGELLVPDNQGRSADYLVRHYVASYLSQMRTRHVYSLLQVADHAGDVDGVIARILNSCAYAGDHLADIFTDRTNPLSIRMKAVSLTGQVGYLDALPDLERLEARLESRLNGQQSMPFAPSSSTEEVDLLPLVHQAIELLRKP